MKGIFVLLACFFTFVASDQHLHANGPFGKRHTVMDEPTPHACNRGSGVSFRRDVQQLKVSKTSYSSLEEIVVSWTPVTGACKDDFVGVFFSEIPLAAGQTSSLSPLVILFVRFQLANTSTTPSSRKEKPN